MRLISAFLFVIIYFVTFNANCQKPYKRGADAFKRNKYELAINFFTQSIRGNENVEKSFLLRGKAKAAINDHQGAILDFNEVLLRDNKKYNARMNLAYSYMKTASYIKAKKHYDTILEIHKPTKEVYHRISECYGFMGQPLLTIDYLQKARKLAPNDKEILNNLAFSFLSVEKYDESFEIYSMLFEKDKYNPYLLNNFGYLKYRMGEKQEGIMLIKQSLGLFPTNAYAFKYLALISIEEKKYSDACLYINLALANNYTNKYGSDLEELKSVSLLEKYFEQN